MRMGRHFAQLLRQAKQCKLTHGDFRQLVDCRLSRKGHEKKLEAGGAVRERAAKCIDSLNNDFSRGQLGDEAAPPATGIGKAGMTPWLSIVGIGEDGLDGLGAAARAEVDAARTLVGSARHLAMVPPDGRERLEWPRPFSTLAGELRARSGKRVCVLATGDPFCYGVGTTLARDFSPGEMRVHPAPSCFSLVCARLGWSLPEVETLTLHGRPLAAFRAAVQPGMRVLALGHDATTPARVAEMLCEEGYGESRVVVLEHLGGAAERVREAPARTFPLEDVRAFNAVAVECVPGPDAPLRSRSPGLPDDAFAHDGLLTRRVLRAAALSALAPVSGQLLWDVGAGCGSVAVEWMRAARGARAVAVERDPGRLALIERNAERLGVPDLRIVRGEAPASSRAWTRPMRSSSAAASRRPICSSRAGPRWAKADGSSHTRSPWKVSAHSSKRTRPSEASCPASRCPAPFRSGATTPSSRRGRSPSSRRASGDRWCGRLAIPLI